MNRKVSIVLGLIVVGSISGAGYWWQTANKEPLNRTSLVLYGNVDIREVDLTFNNSEHIGQLLVQEGDRVSKGQLLATLHKERLQAELAVAEANVAVQKAVVARFEAGSRPEEVRQARANVSAARSKLTDAQVTFKRMQKLFEKKLISRQSVDDAQAILDTARANLKVAEEALALAVKGPRSEDIDAARALLQANEAQLALAREVLKDTELYAPENGIIRNRILEPGDMATPQIPVFTLALTNPVWVRTYVPETELGRLSPGMSAEVSTDSYPDKTYLGWIGYISPTAEFTPKSVETPELRTRLVYQLRVYICNPRDELHLGMPVTVTVPLRIAQRQPGQAVPACTPSGDG